METDWEIFPVQVGQNALQRLYDDHLGAHGGPDGGQLHTDDAAADDDHGLPGGDVVQQLVAGHHAPQVQPGDGGTGGDGTGGDQDVRALIGALSGPDGLGAGDDGVFSDPIDLVGLEEGGHSVPQGGDHLVFPGGQPGPVGLYAAQGDAGDALLQLLIALGGVHQGLGGDASPVETGAAGLPRLKEGDFLSQLRGLDGGGKAAGSTADNKQIILHGSYLQSFDKKRRPPMERIPACSAAALAVFEKRVEPVRHAEAAPAGKRTPPCGQIRN